VGVDVPQRVRADPAPRRQAPGLPVEFHDLRSGRRRPARRLRHPGPQPGRQTVPAPAGASADLGGQKRVDRLRDLRRARPHGPGAAGRRRVPRVPGSPAGGQRHGLRRPAPRHRQPAAGVPRRARALPAAIPARVGRRVPGHQPGAERAGAPARGRAPQRLGRRRQRPVHLRVSRCRHPEHLAVRGGVSRDDRGRPGTELPVDADHPRRGQRRDRQQHHAQAEGAVDRADRSATKAPGWRTR
jgi:hypothetical protein